MIKNLIKNIVFNYLIPLVLGIVFFILLTSYISDFDESNIHWYYISIALCSAGGIACLIYLIIELWKKRVMKK